MKSHPYLRAYMSGISVPTPLLLIALTLFSIARFVYDVPIPVERVIIFPMTIIPNLFGVWNVLYLASRSHTHLPLGIHGAVLPFILAPLGFLLGRSLGPEGDRPRLPLLWCRERALRAHSNCLSRGADCLLPGLEVPDRILQSSGRNRGVVSLSQATGGCMSQSQSGGVSTVARGPQYLTAAASLVVGGAFFALWFWLLPQWLGFRVDTTGTARWRWLAALPSVLGFAVALRCVWDFGWTGRGTPAPFAPPQRLVVVGLYRHVRNPMYLGLAVGWIGLWVIFGHANPAAIAGVAAVALAIRLFVLFYEEPALRGKFGADYEEYCRNVDRWWPRVRGWDKQ